jgi:3-oxoacyl-[acyl-carrier protein] reductase
VLPSPKPWPQKALL